jgi:DNA-directed RNA polymerase subunit RPC12/RpoP
MDFDLTENACEICGEIFFTYYTAGLEGTDPNFCPYCGVKFTTKNGEKRNDA